MIRTASLVPVALSLVAGLAWSAPASPAQASAPPPLQGLGQPAPGTGTASVSGSLRVWEPVTVRFDGPSHSERDDAPNPFLDYRLVAGLLSPSGQLYLVQGYFDGDGQGGSSGDQWTFKFTPDAPGTWVYAVSFRQGTDVAVSDNLFAGTPVSFNGTFGTVAVDVADPNAEGFHKYGLLQQVGRHYRKFVDGPYFLKTGVGGPENLFGYRGFDNTVNQPGGGDDSGLTQGLHQFAPHVGDFEAGDPLFTGDQGVDSRGLVGAINYIASQGLNSIYFLANNLGGDGRDTYPWVGPATNTFELEHFDLSKLHQWGLVLDHAMRKGVMVHFGLGEGLAGNTLLLDNGTLGTQRRLFYREMVARFGHLLALEWDLCQDNLYPLESLDSFAAYIRGLDPYRHAMTFQTTLLPADGDYPEYTAALGDPRLSVASLFHDRADTGDVIERWREDSAAAGLPWAVDSVVQWPRGTGLSEDNADTIREEVLWDALFSGGGVEFYLGEHQLPEGGNLRLEDFRTRDEMWDYVAHARKLVTLMPYWDMEPADQLLTGESTTRGGGEVFRLPGVLYAIYYPDTSVQGTLDLSETGGGVFAGVWYDPRNGVFVGAPVTLPGGGPIAVVPPPGATGGGAFLEQNGLIVMQMESTPRESEWSFGQSVAGWTGTGYYRYDGPNRFGSPGPVMRFDIEVTNPGTYNFSIRNYHDNPIPDQDNDCWVQLTLPTFQKVFSNEGSSTVGVWNWSSRFESTGSQAQYTLGAGSHTIYISGRSNGFHIDRIHLWRDSVIDPLDENLPESPRDGAGSPEDWVFVLVRIG